MKALFELFRRFDARRIFGFIRRLGGMSRPKVKCYDLRSNHALRVEGDRFCERRFHGQLISIHALRVEGDLQSAGQLRAQCIISIHALRVEGDAKDSENVFKRAISIHALRVEGDDSIFFISTPPMGISIHALRVEGDLKQTRPPAQATRFLSTPSGWRATSTFRQYFSRCPRFLSTPSGWRATGHLGRGAPKRFYFYPRPPGGGRPARTTRATLGRR